MVDEEYDEVEAVVRVPKGERLADSRRSEGWYRGFTPKSSSKGPEHVEIWLKAEGGSIQEAEANHIADHVEAWPPDELSASEQAVADFLSRIINEAIDAAKPFLADWWNTQAVPAMRTKRDDFLKKRQVRRAVKARGDQTSRTALATAQTVENDVASEQALADPGEPKVTLTAEQLQQLFMVWLAREDAQRGLWNAIANAQIEDGDAEALTWRQRLSELTPQQRTERVKEILCANPSILADLGWHLMDRRPIELDAMTFRVLG